MGLAIWKNEDKTGTYCNVEDLSGISEGQPERRTLTAFRADVKAHANNLQAQLCSTLQQPASGVESRSEL